VYSAGALYFAPVFFPSGDQTAQLLKSAAIFAVGFFARPVGAWLMGLYADRAGRRAALALSVGMMCLGSLTIALTPGADRIGRGAAALLLLARLVQGLSLGGEYGASATYLSEMASRRHRGFWSSFSYVTLIGGQLTALAVLIGLEHSLTSAQMRSFGWRVPFAIGAALALLAYLLRYRIEESESFTRAKAAHQQPVGVPHLMSHHRRETLIVLVLSAGGSLVFYIYATYMQKFLANSAGFSRNAASELSALTLCVFMLAQPLFGYLSDRLGRKPMIVTAFAGATLLTYPLLSGIQASHSAYLAGTLIVIGILIQSCYTSISAVFKAEMFPTAIRSLGVSLPYALGNAAFGGTAEYVALWFKKAGIESGFYWYASAVACASLIAALAMRDTKRYSHILEG
jgi:MHS family alpha-ketoglutarate permease-like MFS transporter